MMMTRRGVRERHRMHHPPHRETRRRGRVRKDARARARIHHHRLRAAHHTNAPNHQSSAWPPLNESESMNRYFSNARPSIRRVERAMRHPRDETRVSVARSRDSRSTLTPTRRHSSSRAHHPITHATWRTAARTNRIARTARVVQNVPRRPCMDLLKGEGVDRPQGPSPFVVFFVFTLYSCMCTTTEAPFGGARAPDDVGGSRGLFAVSLCVPIRGHTTGRDSPMGGRGA